MHNCVIKDGSVWSYVCITVGLAVCGFASNVIPFVKPFSTAR